VVERSLMGIVPMVPHLVESLLLEYRRRGDVSLDEVKRIVI
jgi:hypothetical protein